MSKEKSPTLVTVPCEPIISCQGSVILADDLQIKLAMEQWGVDFIHSNREHYLTRRVAAGHFRRNREHRSRSSDRQKKGVPRVLLKRINPPQLFPRAVPFRLRSLQETLCIVNDGGPYYHGNSIYSRILDRAGQTRAG
jgi:hypothetical protein